MGKVLVAVKAQARHGKDTVVEILEEFGFQRVAFADPLKESALALNPYVAVDRLLFFSQTRNSSSYSGFMRLADLIQLVGSFDAAKEHPDVRRLLQRLGTEVGRDILGPQLGFGDKLWITITANKVKSLDQSAISDLRFPNEGSWVHEEHGYIWDVFRPNFNNGVDTNHPSERFVKDIPHDYQLLNTGGDRDFKEVLRKQVIIGLELIKTAHV